jgi:hypothetical protein
LQLLPCLHGYQQQSPNALCRNGRHQGFIGLRHRISAAAIDPNLAVAVLFSALGLLAAFYFMTHFPLSAEDATFLTQWL